MDRMDIVRGGLIGLILAFGLSACGGGEETPAPGAPGATPGAPTEPAAPAAPSAPATGQVCAGESHSCVLRPNGSVVCSGRNRDGQLGDGTAQDSLTFVPVVGLTNAIDIDCQHDHTCAVRADGHVVCWGRGDEGQLGAISAPTQVPVEIAGITDAVEVSTGHSFSCARRSTGGVVCWGKGESGELGNGATANSTSAVEVAGLTDASGIDSGYGHTCVVRTTGAVSCWGANSSGALGSGDTTRSAQPVEVAGVTGATMIGAGGYHSCAVSPAGLQCWGGNSYAQIGNGNEGESSVARPFTVPGQTGITGLALGTQRTCVTTGAEVRCWGYNNFTASLLGIENDGARNVLTPTVVPGIADVASLASGYDFSCGIRTGGALACFGSISDGQSGEGARQSHAPRDTVPNILTLAPPASTPSVFTPTPEVTATPSPQLAYGTSHVCHLTADAHVRCFGENGSGQLGNGSTISVSSSSATPIPSISDAVRVVAHQSTTCAVRANGQVACWGSLSEHGTPGWPISSSLPVALSGIPEATDMAIADGTMCFVLRDGTVNCVGLSNAGQLGHGSRESSETPVAVAGLTDVTRLASGGSTFCALRSTGTISCWGSDYYGGCGNGPEECGTALVEVSGIRNATAIDGSSETFCAIAGGTVSCWGNNDYGQLGNGRGGRGEKGEAPSAVRGIRGATWIGVGTQSACAINGAGEAFCWGANTFGTSGADDAGEEGHNPELTPIQVHRTADEAVAAFQPYSSVDCGLSYCCGVHRDGNVSCWGSTPLGGSGGLLGFSSVRSAHPIPARGTTVPMAAPAAD